MNISVLLVLLGGIIELGVVATGIVVFIRMCKGTIPFGPPPAWLWYINALALLIILVGAALK